MAEKLSDDDAQTELIEYFRHDVGWIKTLCEEILDRLDPASDNAGEALTKMLKYIASARQMNDKLRRNDLT